MEEITLITLLVAIVSLGLLATVAYQLSSGRKQKTGSDTYFDIMQNHYNFSLPAETAEYLELRKSKDLNSAEDKKALAAALMKRAMAVLPLVQRIQSDHNGMWKLRSKNMIRDSVFNSLLEAEQVLQQEINAIQSEAQRLRPEENWGHVIFPQARSLLEHMSRSGGHKHE